MDRLKLFVLLFELSLHFEISLTLFLDPLLLHVPEHTGMHGLARWLEIVKQHGEGVCRTAFSAVCAQWTNAIIPTAPTIVLARVSLDAVDIFQVMGFWQHMPRSAMNQNSLHPRELRAKLCVDHSR